MYSNLTEDDHQSFNKSTNYSDKNELVLMISLTPRVVGVARAAL